jgi:hypothetical protein
MSGLPPIRNADTLIFLFGGANLKRPISADLYKQGIETIFQDRFNP